MPKGEPVTVMSREFKALPFTNLKSEASGRVRTGIAAVFGNIDSYGDRVMPGAFAKTIAEGARRCRHLWNHSYEHPPTASIVELREVSRGELPPEVLAKSPDATGGLVVKREYYDTELSNWILAAIDKGDINEMSFAYDTVQAVTKTEPDPNDPEKSVEVHELTELRLYDTSDVLWGCNWATVANGAKGILGRNISIGVLAEQLTAFHADVKAGRRNASGDQKLIELIHDTAIDLGAVCNTGTEDNDDATDPKRSGKSKAEAAPSDENGDTSPSLDWLNVTDLEIASIFS